MTVIRVTYADGCFERELRVLFAVNSSTPSHKDDLVLKQGVRGLVSIL